MTVCSSCGQENPPIAQFCLACGRPLAGARAPSREERRIVTVIFVDLVGFTSRAETLDPEDVRAILAPYHDRVRDEIESFGGVVEKFIGDAVVGVFGAPTAYGDDPERAVRAALSVRAALGTQVRIAVNTGEALVTIGARPERGEAMVAGDVINTAARLQSAAPAGGVLVGAETYRCTNGLVDYAVADPVMAKGKELPVEVWRADRVASGDGRPGAELVGRVGELAMLKGIWERATAGTPHLVTVLGPPGVGKSRLASRVRRGWAPRRPGPRSAGSCRRAAAAPCAAAACPTASRAPTVPSPRRSSSSQASSRTTSRTWCWRSCGPRASGSPYPIRRWSPAISGSSSASTRTSSRRIARRCSSRYGASSRRPRRSRRPSWCSRISTGPTAACST